MSIKMATSAHYSRAGAGASFSASATVGVGGVSASASLSVRAQVKQPPVPTTPQKAAYNILSNHRYHVAIDGLEHAAFNEVSGLQIETETMDFIEGGVNDRVLRLPVRSKMGNITLKRGVVSGQQLLEWYLSVVGGYLDVRNVTIIVYQPNGSVLVRFELLQAYPVKWSGPQFAGSGDAVAVETLELAHAGFLQISR
ncbi:phage tail protein [Deinococcus arcticus]|nr:phage tail protein [Deinococcus arcticus]